jgi:chemotaxis protein histidine kinase CheA/ActR/RegA family two-component response regulator
MNSPQNPSSFSPIDFAEEQLQAELREMFVVDTQQHLASYFSTVKQLNAASWMTDIQHIYRAIHTIKGGAVTVEADGMLYGATVLEDLLSDLRYLEVAPDLTDGLLVTMLLEAGELLTSTMEVSSTGELAAQQVAPTIDRLQAMQAQIKQRYLPEWNEQKQLHQEFADEGFDLVVLELEISLERMTDGISAKMRQGGIGTVEQLLQIGRDIELESSWERVLADFQSWLLQADETAWRSQLISYLGILKECVRNSGILDDRLEANLAALYGSYLPEDRPTAHAQPEDWVAADESIDLDFETLTLGDDPLASEHLMDLENLDHLELLDNSAAVCEEDLDGLADFDLFDEPLDLLDDDLETFDRANETEDPEHQRLVETAESLFTESDPEEFPTDFSGLLGDWDDEDATISQVDGFELDFFLADEQNLELTELSATEETEDYSILDEILVNDELFVPAAPAKAANLEARRQIQVPVPLERLDRAAQQVADTLLSARGVMNLSQQLQAQLVQLAELTNDSAQFITHLRQLQDDYALLRQYSNEPSSNVSVERYRQGYTSINRLLENILRMSELGREIEISTQQTTSSLVGLDRNILNLKDRIESSRLVPFRNLTMRARAILRDLTNRYDKPADLTIENEAIELDAGVVQQLEPVLLHLLRNAYDHGLESPATRQAQGKPVKGKIRVSLKRRGNVYILEIGDDGAGINASEIARKAQVKGFGLTNTGTAAGLLAVLCQPGLSSKDTVSEVSGRGVGMDVVASQVEAMGGKLSLQTVLGQGTTFFVEVPAPQLLVSCVLVKVGDRIIAMPTEEVLETVLIDNRAIKTGAGWQIPVANSSVVAWDLNSYWQQPVAILGETAIGIRSRWNSFQQQAEWLIADDLIGQVDLLLSPLPHPIVPPTGMLGVSLQPDGSLISVFDPGAVLNKLRFQVAAPDNIPAEKSAPRAATQILVVDDAALMRRRIESSLNNHGFATHSCGDGLEALQWIEANGAPTLLITDIEMPQMDGFTLVDRCRQQGLQMPIVVVSSRLSEEWSREAKRLGANQYLNKGFKTNELIDTVRSLLQLQLVESK